MVVTLIFISFLLCHSCGFGAAVFARPVSCFVWAVRCDRSDDRGGVREHRDERTRIGGTEPARHPPAAGVQVSAGKDAVVHPRWTPRSQPPAAPAGVWTPLAAP